MLPPAAQRGGPCRSRLPDRRTPTECIELFDEHGIALAAGPIQRFGAQGRGTTVYCHDPSGNEIELISYAAE
jgi:hypothetical protein